MSQLRSADVAFYLAMATLFTHELDAMPNHEWRGMPGLRDLPDATAMPIFVAGHLPLFAILIALVASSKPRIRERARLVIGAFVVLHGMLHLLSMRKPTYEFDSTLSHVLIFGGAAFGALYLTLEGARRLGARSTP